jgi:hypothetical protein
VLLVKLGVPVPARLHAVAPDHVPRHGVARPPPGGVGTTSRSS